MVEPSIEGDLLHLELLGWSKLLAFAWGLDIPLRCVVRAAAGKPGVPRFGWGDVRILGTGAPGAIAAGRYSLSRPRRRAFFDLRRASREVLALALRGYRYDEVTVEVRDVREALTMIEAAMKEAAPRP